MIGRRRIDGELATRAHKLTEHDAQYPRSHVSPTGVLGPLDGGRVNERASATDAERIGRVRTWLARETAGDDA